MRLGQRRRRARERGNVVPDPTRAWNTEGALYAITKRGLDGLDANEGYPRHYDRKELDVYLDDGSRVGALVYIAQPNMVAEGLKPTKVYLARYLTGRDLLSPRYYGWLEKIETLD